MESCILSQTDNTSAVGWLSKLNFSDVEDSAAQLTAARHLASLIINNVCCLYSQWFTGDLGLTVYPVIFIYQMPSSLL
jgi:hypothetical protein